MRSHQIVRGLNEASYDSRLSDGGAILEVAYFVAADGIYDQLSMY